jgi:hypothetical protein
VPPVDKKDLNRNFGVLFGEMTCRCRTTASVRQGVELTVAARKDAGDPFSKRKKNGRERFVCNKKN